MMYGAASKGKVQVTVNTLDKGDDTIIFRTNEATGQIYVKEAGKKSRSIDTEEANLWMNGLRATKWGLTTEAHMLPEWALTT